MTTPDASIDFLDSIPSEVLQESGPHGRAYDLQLSLARAERELAWQRELLYEEIAREERQRAIGSLTPAHERVERDSSIVELRERVTTLTTQVNTVQAELGGIVFLPAVDNLPKIEKQLKALNRKADAIGTGAITLNVSEEKLVLNYAYAEDGERAEHGDFAHVFAVLAGGTPKIPGYEFLATVVPTEHGNVVNKIPAIRYGITHNLEFGNADSEDSAAKRALDAIDLSRFVHTGADCEHCHQPRDRKNLYVVYNDKTGEALQIGRSCLRDYMGTNDPERVLSALEMYREIYRMASSRSAQEVLRTTTFLTHCAAIVRTEGGYQRGLGAMAVRNYFDMKRDNRYRGQKTYVTPQPADEAAAAHMLRWVRTEWDESGEFPEKVKIALAGESVDERLHNIAGAAFAAYPRWVEGAAKRAERQAAQADREAAKAAAQFIGTEGQRETFTLTVNEIKWFSTQFGEKAVIKLADEAGNPVTWFTSNLPRVADKAQADYDGPEIGATYQVKATVKEHETHETFGKSTVITRAKFEKTINEPQENNE